MRFTGPHLSISTMETKIGLRLFTNVYVKFNYDLTAEAVGKKRNKH